MCLDTRQPCICKPCCFLSASDRLNICHTLRYHALALSAASFSVLGCGVWGGGVSFFVCFCFGWGKGVGAGLHSFMGFIFSACVSV